MRILFFILLILLSLDSISQNDSVSHRHSGVVQLGGQTMFSLHYEYSIIAKKHILVNTNIGFGLNENADDKDPNDRPIYGLHTGMIFLAGAERFYLEMGINPTTYFYKKTTFVNLNSWIGIRLLPKTMEGVFMSLGYTPRLFTSYTGRFSPYGIGIKCGITF